LYLQWSLSFNKCPAWWLTPVILATQEAEIRRITVQYSQGKYFTSLYLENAHLKKGLVAQGVGLEFKP
jgi:hypothetical protein